MRSVCIEPCFLGLGTSCRWDASLTLSPLYSQGMSSWYPLDRRLGGPHRRPGRSGKINILDSIRTRTRTIRSPSPKPVAIPTQLPHFFFKGTAEKLSADGQKRVIVLTHIVLEIKYVIQQKPWGIFFGRVRSLHIWLIIWVFKKLTACVSILMVTVLLTRG
jgi:hypothetical protein